MSLIYAYKGRGFTKDITILDSAGATVTPTSNDVIRAVIGRKGETAKLIVASNAPTANGSTFTKGATNRLRIDASDMTFDSGVYTLTVDLFDNADGAEWKMIEKQCMCVEDTT